MGVALVFLVRKHFKKPWPNIVFWSGMRVAVKLLKIGVLKIFKKPFIGCQILIKKC